MSRGDVIVGTQPIEWRPPPNSRIVDLMPLSRARPSRVHASSSGRADEAQPCHGAAYEAAVAIFMRRALDEAPSEDERRAAELMLVQSIRPRLRRRSFGSREHAFGDCADRRSLQDRRRRAPGKPGYRALTGRPFPLRQFGLHAVATRLEDRNWLNPDEFPAETPCLLEQKLLHLPRAEGRGGGRRPAHVSA